MKISVWQHLWVHAIDVCFGSVIGGCIYNKQRRSQCDEAPRIRRSRNSVADSERLEQIKPNQKATHSHKT